MGLKAVEDRGPGDLTRCALWPPGGLCGGM